MIVAMASDGTIYPVVNVEASNPSVDLVLLRLGLAINNQNTRHSDDKLRPLPINPYPVPIETELDAHMSDYWKWKSCTLRLYRDSIGRESKVH